jgi:hypothetical protein
MSHRRPAWKEMRQRPIQRQCIIQLFPWKMRWYEIDVENRDYHYVSQSEIAGAKRIYRHLIGCSWQTIAPFFRVFLRLFVFRASYTAIG